MGAVVLDITMSLDGFVAGPNDSPDHPLGLRDGDRLHDWLFTGDTGTSSFVTDGVKSAVERAKAAAGDKVVSIGGGASPAQQCLRAGVLDEIRIQLAPLLLGDGIRRFDDLGPVPIQPEQTRVIEAPGITHVRYRVVT